MTEHVDWSAITPHLPHGWRGVGKPHPLKSGGALFIVRLTMKHLGTRYALVRYDDDGDTIRPYVPPTGSDTKSYPTSRTARVAVESYAEMEDDLFTEEGQEEDDQWPDDH